MSRRLLCGLTLLTLLGVSACTSGNVTEVDSSTPAAAAPTSTPPSMSPPSMSPSTPSSTPVSTQATTAPPSSTGAPSTTSAPAEAPIPVFTTTCTALSVRVLKGGAIRGAEVAALQFVNDGQAACTITGTPTAQLQRGGSPIGRRSQVNGDTVRPYTVPPGDYAESLLRDFSTCNAPLSDALQLRLPGRGGERGKSITEPIKLRGCTLQVAPAGQPS